MERLLPQLSMLSLPRDVVVALVEPWKLAADRFHLAVDGGSPWRMFQNELATYRLAYREASFGYKIYKGLVMALTLLMPPARFCQVKQWYAHKGLRRFREKLGNPVQAEPIQVLRKIL